MLRPLHDHRTSLLSKVHEPLDPQQIWTPERCKDLDDGRKTLPRKWDVEPHTKRGDSRAMSTREQSLTTVSTARAGRWVNGPKPTRQRHVVNPRPMETQAGQLRRIEGTVYRFELPGLWIHCPELRAQRFHALRGGQVGLRDHEPISHRDLLDRLGHLRQGTTA